MEFQLLKKSHLKRNIIIGVVVVAIISAVVLNFTRAKYVYTDKMPLINGTVNYSLADLNIVAIYVGGVEVDSLDSSKQYTLDTTQSTCSYKDGSTIEGLNISYETETGSLSISPFTMKGTKCTLYFDEITGQTIQDILAEKDIASRDDFSTTLSDDTTGTIYQAHDDDGTTYYFAGSPTDNWVSFAGFYWRIIRINGDGSIRLIYQGTSANTTGSGTQIQTSAFNSSNNNNMYVGYMYTSGQVHGLGTSSAIKGILDTWYHDNLLTNYDGYIDKDAGFCNDRTPHSGTGAGTITTFYGAYNRLNNTNKTPTFNCEHDNDLYTAEESGKGNNSLTYPIGLITADEVAYAGGAWNANNTSYYLYTNSAYWTMSPYYFVGVSAYAFDVSSSGYLNNNFVNNSGGVRPVINLKASTIFEMGGTGTSTNPYVVI